MFFDWLAPFRRSRTITDRATAGKPSGIGFPSRYDRTASAGVVPQQRDGILADTGTDFDKASE